MSDDTPPTEVVPDRRYAKPPVVEALCEVYFSGSHWDGTTLGLFYDRVRAEFPDKTPVLLGEFGLSVRLGEGAPQARSMPIEQRIRFTHPDRPRMLQLSRDLLVVNQLPPYPDYEEWREVVLDAVGHYREVAAPTGIDRVGMRYLNRINIPSPGGQLAMEDFFSVHPNVPNALGGGHGPFMLQLLILPLNPQQQLTMTLTQIPPDQPDHMTFILDLYDVVGHEGRDIFAEMPAHLDAAHARIIRVFENAITDKCRAMFQEVSNG